MSSGYLLILSVVTTFLALSTSYPTGAPEETCTAFTAGHTGHNAQNSPHKYVLSASPSSVSSGGTITVTLQGTGGEKLKGFFIQGQDASTKQPVGKFLKQSDAQTRDCSGPGSANAATHVSASDKSKVMIKWQAPANFKGSVVFRAVVVKTYELFWNNIYSSPLTVA